MRRSVPPETIEHAEQHRAAMAAATRVQGVLIPPGTTTVILDYGGPVDVPALYAALGAMIQEGDLAGLSPQTLETTAPTREPAGGGVIDGSVHRVGDDGCVLEIPRLGAPTSEAQIAEQFAPVFASIAQAIATPDDDGHAPGTPLAHLRAHGPATAAQLAAALGVTRQKAAKQLTALTRAGHVEKTGALYTAAVTSAASP